MALVAQAEAQEQVHVEVWNEDENCIRSPCLKHGKWIVFGSSTGRQDCISANQLQINLRQLSRFFYRNLRANPGI